MSSLTWYDITENQPFATGSELGTLQTYRVLVETIAHAPIAWLCHNDTGTHYLTRLLEAGDPEDTWQYVAIDDTIRAALALGMPADDVFTSPENTATYLAYVTWTDDGTSTVILEPTTPEAVRTR
jgi:hypothetical protein